MIDSVGTVPDLNHGSPVPLWEQLAARLRADIESGRLTGQVPSAKGLSVGYGVSKATAEKALRALISEGLLVGRAGRGTFVVRREEE